MARVSGVGTPSLTSDKVEYTQLRSLPIFSLRTMSGVTEWRKSCCTAMERVGEWGYYSGLRRLSMFDHVS